MRSGLSQENRIDTIRSFNRLFTRQIGVLREGLLHSKYSLTEVRIMFELAQSNNKTASNLARELGLDAGYMSRTLTKFEKLGLIEKTQSEQDGRQVQLCLSPEGEKVFSELDRRSRDEIATMLNDITEENQTLLLGAMQTIQSILDKKYLKYSEAIFLRTHEPGDMGWITHRHGLLYAQEYGWDEHFEALVSLITSEFISNFKPDRERCWIAEMNGEIVGSVLVVQSSDTDAKLRLLLVEPKARGLGLGTRLVQECIRFARRAHYKKLILWTNSVLTDARNIYQKSGFKLVSQEAHHSFGHDLEGEIWELIL